MHKKEDFSSVPIPVHYPALPSTRVEYFRLQHIFESTTRMEILYLKRLDSVIDHAKPRFRDRYHALSAVLLLESPIGTVVDRDGRCFS